MSSLRTMILTTMTTTMSEKNAAFFRFSVNFKESAGNPFDFKFFLGMILTNLQCVCCSSSQNVKTVVFFV